MTNLYINITTKITFNLLTIIPPPPVTKLIKWIQMKLVENFKTKLIRYFQSTRYLTQTDRNEKKNTILNSLLIKN